MFDDVNNVLGQLLLGLMIRIQPKTLNLIQINLPRMRIGNAALFNTYYQRD